MKTRDSSNRKYGESGIRGLCWNKVSKRWVIKLKNKYIAQFKELEDAKRKLEHIKLLEEYKKL